MPSSDPPEPRAPDEAAPSVEGTRLAAWVDRRRPQIGVAAAALAVCVGFGAYRFDNFPLDDAYIHLSYGKYFQLQHLLSFNGHGPDTGTSSWTWTFVCILVEQLGLPPHVVLTTLGIASLVVVLWVAMELTRQLLPPRTVRASWWPYLSALLVLVNGNIIWLTLSGMEALLGVALTLAFVHRVLLWRGLDGWAGLLGLAMVWTRVEFVIWLVGTLVCLPLLERGRRGKPGWAALPLAGLALNLAYNQLVSGSLLPTSAAGKRATFVDQTHDVSRAARFLHDVHRDYVTPFLAGWDLLLWAMVAAALVLTVGLGLTLATRNRRRRRVVLGPKTLTLVVILGGTLVHSIAYLVHFRTVYHHFRYFTPLLIVVPGLVVPCTALALTTLKKLTRRVNRRPLGRQLLLMLDTGVVWLAIVAVVTSGWVFPFWQRLYVRNVTQLGAVHIDLAHWLVARAAEFPNRRVACFDIGALRYYSGFEIVDLGGIIDRQSLDYRLGRHTDRQIFDTRPDAFISVENGFDYVPMKHRRYHFSLEYLRGWQFPEYLDPVPPHTKRLLLYRINHCGAPRQVRKAVGQAITFDSARERQRRRWGVGKGKSFAIWPTLRSAAGKRHGAHRGAGYLTSEHPTAGDKAEGVWESRPLRVEGQWLSLLLAGGRDEERLRVELRDEADQLVHVWTGYRTNAFIEEVLPLKGLEGQHLRVRVIDQHLGRWGHIAVDDIHQFDWVEQPAIDCPPAG